eukprot:7726877-Alexandrium_andersonii.AAC.1
MLEGRGSAGCPKKKRSPGRGQGWNPPPLPRPKVESEGGARCHIRAQREQRAQNGPLERFGNRV